MWGSFYSPKGHKECVHLVSLCVCHLLALVSLLTLHPQVSKQEHFCGTANASPRHLGGKIKNHCYISFSEYKINRLLLGAFFSSYGLWLSCMHTLMKTYSRK